VCIM